MAPRPPSLAVDVEGGGRRARAVRLSLERERGRCLVGRREATMEERAERQQVAGKRERRGGGGREKEPHRRREGDVEKEEGTGDSVAFILFE